MDLLALFQLIAQKSEVYSLRSKLRRTQVELDSLRYESIDDDIIHTGMGILKGYNQLQQLLGQHFYEFINSMGIFIGFLHYSPNLEFTGNDLEYVFATSCGSSNRPIIYVLDFGEALEKITSIDDITYAMVFSGHSYPVSNGEFWEGYLAVAKYFDKLDLATEVEKEVRE